LTDLVRPRGRSHFFAGWSTGNRVVLSLPWLLVSCSVAVVVSPKDAEAAKPTCEDPHRLWRVSIYRTLANGSYYIPDMLEGLMQVFQGVLLSCGKCHTLLW
jgi:hypothetical protein